MGEHCPVLQLCPTFPHPVPIPELVFLDEEDSSHQQLGDPIRAGSSFGVRSAPSWFSGIGVVYSWDVLDNELSRTLVPIPLLVCVPSIHQQTRGAAAHFLLKCGNFSDFTENLSALTSHLQPVAFSLFILSLALFLVWRRAGISRGQRTLWQFCPTKEHFPVSSSFPSLLPCPFQRRRLEVGFLRSPSRVWRLTQWN